MYLYPQNFMQHNTAQQNTTSNRHPSTQQYNINKPPATLDLSTQPAQNPPWRDRQLLNASTTTVPSPPRTPATHRKDGHHSHTQPGAVPFGAGDGEGLPVVATGNPQNWCQQRTVRRDTNEERRRMVWSRVNIWTMT